MNERITEGNEMLLFCSDTKEAMEKVLSNMIKTRPLKEVYYKPYLKTKGVGFKAPLGGVSVDFNDIYPEAEIGDFAYFEFDIIPMYSLDVLLNVRGEGEIIPVSRRLAETSVVSSAFSAGNLKSYKGTGSSATWILM